MISRGVISWSSLAHRLARWVCPWGIRERQKQGHLALGEGQKQLVWIGPRLAWISEDVTFINIIDPRLWGQRTSAQECRLSPPSNTFTAFLFVTLGTPWIQALLVWLTKVDWWPIFPTRLPRKARLTRHASATHALNFVATRTTPHPSKDVTDDLTPPSFGPSCAARIAS